MPFRNVPPYLQQYMTRAQRLNVLLDGSDVPSDVIEQIQKDIVELVELVANRDGQIQKLQRYE